MNDLDIQHTDFSKLKATFGKEEILEPIGKIASALHRYMQVYISRSLMNGKYGIGPGQLYVLLTVAFNEGHCQKEIGRELMIEKATIAKAVKALANIGYVRTEADPDDKRHMKVFLSDRGHAIMPSILLFMDEMHQTILNGFSDQEVEVVFHLINRMNRNLLKSLTCANKECPDKYEAQ